MREICRALRKHLVYTEDYLKDADVICLMVYMMPLVYSRNTRRYDDEANLERGLEQNERT